MTKLKRCKAIAKCILCANQASQTLGDLFPGQVKLKHNEAMIPKALKDLERLGHKKPWLVNSSKFVVSTIFSNEDILAQFLPSCTLIYEPPDLYNNKAYVWKGDGTPQGRTSFSNIIDSSGRMPDNPLLVIDIFGSIHLIKLTEPELSEFMGLTAI